MCALLHRMHGCMYQVTPDCEADIQPAGKEDGHLGVTEGAPVAPAPELHQIISSQAGGVLVVKCAGIPAISREDHVKGNHIFVSS